MSLNTSFFPRVQYVGPIRTGWKSSNLKELVEDSLRMGACLMSEISQSLTAFCSALLYLTSQFVNESVCNLVRALHEIGIALILLDFVLWTIREIYY